MVESGLGSTTRRRWAGVLAGAAAVLASLLAGAASAATLATPTLTTVASASAPVGGSITDLAVLVGGAAPTGTVTFALYDVSDTKCAGTPVFTSTVPLSQPTTSGAYTPTKAGTYNWIATYNGDAANNKVSGKCGDLSETVAVTALTPTVTTVASPSVALGGRIGDTAVVSGAYKPNGTVTFRLYGPGDPSCAGAPVFTSTLGVSTPTVSAAYTPTVAGTYRFVATYNGDAANNKASGACSDPSESVVVVGPGVKPPPPGPGCDAAGMAKALVNSLVAALTGAPGAAFKATCSAGVRIVLRAREIRPGNPGIPHHDGFTTMANALTHTTPDGQVAFSLNNQGVALRSYAQSNGASLVVFAIVHVRPDKTSQSAEAIQIFNLR
ncbi:MAG: hypothetical protein QOF77_140 [Solirubrobacteraceae bacterium]|nr:hypothetical protein [Solirubrobacteraceae bacterium]